MTGTPAARARAARVPRFRRSPLARTASSSAGSSARSPMIASWHSMVRSAECAGSSSERRSIGMEADTDSSASAPSTGGGGPVGGRPSLCRAHLAAMMEGCWPGPFAEYVRVSCRQVYRLPPGLDLRTAALTEPLAVALHAVTRSGLRGGETALVTGAGPLGCLCVAALRARGATRVIVSEPSAARRAAALACGAEHVVPPEELEVPASPLVEVAAPVDVVLECSGNPAAFEAGLAQLRPGGTLVIVGTGLAHPTLEQNRVL